MVSANGSTALSRLSRAVSKGSKSRVFAHSEILPVILSTWLRIVSKISAACCIISVPRLSVVHAVFSLSAILPIVSLIFFRISSICPTIFSPVPLVQTVLNEPPISFTNPSIFFNDFFAESVTAFPFLSQAFWRGLNNSENVFFRRFRNLVRLFSASLVSISTLVDIVP